MSLGHIRYHHTSRLYMRDILARLQQRVLGNIQDIVNAHVRICMAVPAKAM